ncbi:MAG: SDR family NAD(P)-dependent oxidoreductase, partial [Thermotogaceae bacterium]|nr:SDR family NAD(P)-dependent oxidoreductase [Thermotogaceae bacterium]
MLNDKVAIVTGASSGIGRAIAKRMIEEGAIVIGIARSEDKLQSVKEWLGESFHYKVADVSEYERAQQVVKEVYEEFDRIDILVNNAGIAEDTLLVRMDKEKWQKVIDVNLGGVFNYTKAVLSYMMKQKSGVIINISSVVGLYGNAGQTNYAASKAGIIGFTKSLA